MIKPPRSCSIKDCKLKYNSKGFCLKHYKKFRYYKNLEAIRAYNRERGRKWRAANPDKGKEYYYKKDKETRIKQRKIQYINNRDKILQRCKDYYHNNREKAKQNSYRTYKRKYKTDPIYKTKCLLRHRLREFLKHKKWTKKTKFSLYIGCSQEELKNHLESKFTEGMTWENHGKWHIDHIIPLNSVKTEEELYKLCHYSNLQPLWAHDNISKSDKIK